MHILRKNIATLVLTAIATVNSLAIVTQPAYLQRDYFHMQENTRAAEAQGQWWNGLSGREKFLTYVPMAYPLNEATEKFAGGDSAGEVGGQFIHAGVEGAMFALTWKEG